MRALNRATLEANLLPYVTEEDILALLARRDVLVKFFENEINTKGPDSILLDIPRHTQYVTIP